MVTSRSKKDLRKQNIPAPPKTKTKTKTKTATKIIETTTTDTQDDIVTRSKNFALKFSLLKDKLKADADTEQNEQTDSASDEINNEQTASKKPTITPGCDSEHLLQEKWGTRDRALNFYDRQVLDYLAPKMQEFIA